MSMTEFQHQLHQMLDHHFDREDFLLLCFNLGVDVDNLQGARKRTQVMDLITQMRQQARLPDLLQAAAHLRPTVSWPSPPAAAPETPGTHSAGAPPIVNPFGRSGKIQSPAYYLVRQPLTRQVMTELAKGVSLSIVGDSQTGKSSLLWFITQVGPELLGRSPADFIYLSMELIHGDADFFDCVCAELDLPAKRGFHLARALHGRKIILCLDEIEKMTWDGFSLELRTELRGLADGAKAPFSLVIASRSPLDQLFPDSPVMTSPLAGLCLQIVMPYFTLQESQALVRQYLEPMAAQLPEPDVMDAWQQSYGHPRRLQQLLQQLYAQRYEASSS